MGEAKRRLEVGVGPRKLNETHEPPNPTNWPHSNVNVELTGDDEDECVCVTIHGQRHYLHMSTLAELLALGDAKLNEWLKKNPQKVTNIVRSVRKGNFL